VGSAGDAAVAWKIPACLRGSDGETCALLAQPEGDVELPSCPAWIFPNADAAGYYRFSLSQKDMANLRARGLEKLSPREKLAYATSLRSAFSRATMPMSDVLAAVAPLARDRDPIVAEDPMSYLGQARDWLFGGPWQARVEAYARELYAPAARKLGWDAAVRAEAKKRGRAYLGLDGDGALHPDAVDANVAALAVAVVGEDADRATWNAMRVAFEKSVDETVRGRLLYGLSLAKDAELSSEARWLAVSPSLRDNDILVPVTVQLGRPESREAAWSWLKEHLDTALARLPRHHGGAGLVSSAVRAFCDERHAQEAEALFASKIATIDGGPRTPVLFSL
jgi:alanyl aminopeptidase